MSATPPFLAGLATAVWLAACPIALAESEGPLTAYASLPAPETTGGLPDASSGFRDQPAFQALVERGSITIRAGAPTRCLPGDLMEVVAAVADRFGPVSVESTHRSRSVNARARGARRSFHLACRAIDFRVHARSRSVLAYLRSRPDVGGLKVYRNGIIHIDDGERRSW